MSVDKITAENYLVQSVEPYLAVLGFHLQEGKEVTERLTFAH